MFEEFLSAGNGKSRRTFVRHRPLRIHEIERMGDGIAHAKEFRIL